MMRGTMQNLQSYRSFNTIVSGGRVYGPEIDDVVRELANNPNFARKQTFVLSLLELYSPSDNTSDLAQLRRILGELRDTLNRWTGGMIEIECPCCKAIDRCPDYEREAFAEEYRQAIDRGERPQILCYDCYRGDGTPPRSRFARFIRGIFGRK
jgi:hypothetical protein